MNFIETGDSWNFLDDGSNQGTAWIQGSFDNSSWNVGSSPLGFGDAGLGTTVSFGADADNKFVTTYFRKTFDVADPSVFESLSLSFQRDDGIAIYLNGVEVARDNLSAVATSATFAESAIGGSAELTYLSQGVAANLLVAGENTIAVEIHQAAPSSSDLRFDLRLTGNPVGEVGMNSTTISLSEAGWLLARSFDESTGEWSALNEALFTLNTVPADASNLVVSKIHYNPAIPTGAELAVADEADEFEFIELINVGSETVNLAGVTISGGITFTFGSLNELSAGERIVVTENRLAFEARYPNSLGSVAFALDVDGESEYGGRLSNGGEELILTDAQGGLIRRFTYDNNLPWPTAPDGGGYSLVLRSPAIPIPDHGVGTNWAASAELGGSPGLATGIGFIGDPNVDDDGDGLSALLEYALGSSDSQSGDSTLSAGIEEILVGTETGNYLTISFLRNQHIINAFDIVAEVSADLVVWNSLPDTVLVSDVDNGDGTSTVIYRSGIPVGERPEEREFIRVVVVESP